MSLNKNKTIVPGAIALFLLLFVVYAACVGAFSTVSNQAYKAPAEAPKTDQAKAMVMAEALVDPLEEELDSFFGWLPNDLFFIPSIIDNKTNYQLGVLYATRSASDVLEHEIARYGDRDTIPAMLVNATSQDFAFSSDVWGWWVFYNSEKRYRSGIKNWRLWASEVGNENSKKAQVYNVTTNNMVQIISWANNLMEYTLGVLNDVKVGHFQSDDVIYYVKGICRVVDSVLEGLIQCDNSLVERGGKENVDEVLKRFQMISKFNPVYVVAGSYGVGDSFWPNHIAAMARHIDIVSNRLSDIKKTMEK